MLKLRNELEETRNKLYPQNKNSVLMLYPEVWDSAVSSGVIRLMSPDQVIKLTKVYRFIKGTQYEAEWIRRAIEECNEVPESEKERKQWLENRYKSLWIRHNKRGENLSARIEEVLQEDWWN